MTLDSLELFRDIANSRSLSRAAELNGVSASAASQTVNELERSFGVQFLDRSTRPLSLTAEGKLFNDMCRDVLRRRELFQADLDHHRLTAEGTVSVAAIYSVGLSEMTALEAAFRGRCPSVDLKKVYLRPEKVYEAVRADQVDLGIVSYPESARDLAVIPWRNEEMVAASVPGRFLPNRETLQAADLQGVDFIAFDDDLPIAREIHRYLRLIGVQVNIAMRFDNLQTIKDAITNGSGVSIVPRRVLQSELASGRLHAYELAPPGLNRPLGIIHRKKKRFTRAAQSFLDLLMEDPSDAQRAHAGSEELAVPAGARA